MNTSVSGRLTGRALVQVCRTAGYYQHALFVSQAAAETEWYLDILLEDMQSWDDALAYLQDLPRQQAAAALKKHGKVCSTSQSISM
jgi:hypothetical protein